MTVPVWAWASFLAFVIAMLALDVFVLHRRAHEVSLREAGIWSAVFALLGMRALYFLLAGAAGRLRYLRPGLAVILAAVALKLLLAGVLEFPAWSAPAFITVVLAVVAAASLRDAGRAHRGGSAQADRTRPGLQDAGRPPAASAEPRRAEHSGKARL